MRKLTTLFALLFSLSMAMAQPVPSARTNTESPALKYSRDVVDFTVTDSDGERWTLYDLLDDGKTVIIDFFQST